MIKHALTAPKLLLLFCLCLQLCCQTANSQYLHKLIEDTADIKIDPEVNPVVVGDYVIYQTIENEQRTLWSYDRTSTEKTLLFNDKIYRFHSHEHRPFHDTHLYTVGDFAFFSVFGDFVGNRKIWRTDGTAAGTVPLGYDDRYVIPIIRPLGDLIFAHADEILPGKTASQGLFVGDGLFASDGFTSVEHEIINPYLDTICAFDVNDVISSNWNYTSSKRQILRSSHGKITVLSDLLSGDHNSGTPAMWNLNGICYIGLRKNQATSYEVMIVQQNGAVELLGETVDLTGIHYIFPYQNRLFALQSLAGGESNKLKRFRQDFTGFDAEITLPKSSPIRLNTLPTEDYLIVHDFRNVVGQYTLHYLSSDLVKNSELGGTFYFPQYGSHVVPSVHPTLDGTLYANKTGNFLLTQVLSYDINRNSEPKIELPDEVLFHVTSHHSNPSAYVMLGNKWSGKTTIRAVAQVPPIDQSINGIWHDPNIQNQGMAITTGTRVDGSEYIFVTVYTYANGKPLWLAGVGELGLPQTASIELPLAHYRGINTFEAGVDPEQELFGNLNITMTGCDSMKATFTSHNDVYALDLTRIHNTEFSHLCND